MRKKKKGLIQTWKDDKPFRELRRQRRENERRKAKEAKREKADKAGFQYKPLMGAYNALYTGWVESISDENGVKPGSPESKDMSAFSHFGPKHHREAVVCRYFEIHGMHEVVVTRKWWKAFKHSLLCLLSCCAGTCIFSADFTHIGTDIRVKWEILDHMFLWMTAGPLILLVILGLFGMLVGINIFK